MARRARAARGLTDYWPGFVDVLSTLLLVITFLLSMFMLAQYFLGQQLTSRDQQIASLQSQIAALARELNLVTAARDSTQAERNRLAASLAEAEKAAGERDAAAAKLLTAEEQLALLNQQIEQLRLQLAAIAEALQISEAKNKDAEVKIEDLGKRLNEALAQKALELQRYRSEFFGRLREVLGDRTDIRIEGDRFVFQSEVLFETNSADLSERARMELSILADALKEIIPQIPSDLDWVLRVDGHSDKRPISTAQFPSNLHLSAARAMSVVQFLTAMGVPAKRLSAAGFGDTRPVDPGDGEAAYSRNRRIEFKLTEP